MAGGEAMGLHPAVHSLEPPRPTVTAMSNSPQPCSVTCVQSIASKASVEHTPQALPRTLLLHMTGVDVGQLCAPRMVAWRTSAAGWQTCGAGRTGPAGGNRGGTYTPATYLPAAPPAPRPSRTQCGTSQALRVLPWLMIIMVQVAARHNWNKLLVRLPPSPPPPSPLLPRHG